MGCSEELENYKYGFVLHLKPPSPDLTPDQVQSIFHEITNCANLQLTEQDISFNDLSSVPVDVLVNAISRLETVNLTGTHLTPDQTQGIFQKIANCENLKLTELGIRYNNLSSVPADVLVKAISRLETVDLRRSQLVPAQILAIFTLVAERTSSTLRELNLEDNDLSCVHKNLRRRSRRNISTELQRNYRTGFRLEIIPPN